MNYRLAINTLWLLCAIAAPLCEKPTMVGKATYYGQEHADLPMRNGQPYDPMAMTCAVDRWLWPALAGERLLVCGYDNSPTHYFTFRCVSVIATDTGRLWEHGVVVDLSPTAFLRLAPLEQGVVSVAVWR